METDSRCSWIMRFKKIFQGTYSTVGAGTSRFRRNSAQRVSKISLSTCVTVRIRGGLSTKYSIYNDNDWESNCTVAMKCAIDQ